MLITIDKNSQYTKSLEFYASAEIRDVPIIGSEIGIGHNWPLFLVSVLVTFE